MSETVWKFPLLSNDVFGRTRAPLRIPAGYRVLSVQMQDDIPCLWAQVDPNRDVVFVPVYIVGTGHDVPPGTTYAGTFQDPPYVWHVYLGGER